MKMTKAEARKHAEELRTHARFMRSYGAAPTLIAAIEAGAKSLQDAVDAEPVAWATSDDGMIYKVEFDEPQFLDGEEGYGYAKHPLFTPQLEGE